MKCILDIGRTHKPAPAFLATNEETNVFNSILSKIDETSHGITNETHVVTPAVQRPACQRPQKQDFAYAAYTYPDMYDLIRSAVTQSKGLLRHRAGDQLAMTGTRRIIRSQRITSDGTTGEQSPKSCLARLSNTWWSEVRDHSVETVKCT